MNEPVKLPTTDKDFDIDLDIKDLMPAETPLPKFTPSRPNLTGTSAPRGDDLDNLGRMQAEAATKQFEAAAKACESMSDEVKDRIARLQASMDECARDLKLISEAANAMREKGKAVRAQIEQSAALSKQVRDACADLKRRVAVA